MECHKCFDHCSCRPCCQLLEEDAIDILKSILDRDGFVLERAVAWLESLAGKIISHWWDLDVTTSCVTGKSHTPKGRFSWEVYPP